MKKIETKFCNGEIANPPTVELTTVAPRNKTIRVHHADVQSRLSTADRRGAFDLRVPPDASSTFEKKRFMLQRASSVMEHRIEKIQRRVGLVSNYCVTRSEAVKSPIHSRSLNEHFQVLRGALVKMALREDFRDLAIHQEFNRILRILSYAAKQNLENDVKAILNRPVTSGGKTILQSLIKKRQLKFVKSLLFACADQIDLNKQDYKGQTALDIAYDRLEVEAAFLLRALGARRGQHADKNGRSCGECLRTDLIANLDTGRYVNRDSIKTMMDDFIRFWNGELVSWFKSPASVDDSILRLLGAIPRIYSITLADGADAITNHDAWAGMVRMVLRQLTDPHLSVASIGNIPGSEREPWSIEAYPHLDDLLEELRLDGNVCTVYGRTLFFERTDGANIAIKIAKKSEQRDGMHPLIKEAMMNAWVCDNKDRLGLKSLFPSGSRVVSFEQLSENIQQKIKQQALAGYCAFEIDNTIPVIALLYYSPPGYNTYLNDATIPVHAVHSGFSDAAFDYGRLIRSGLFHCSLIDMQHDAGREKRPHVWSFESFLTRFRVGAGRVDGGFSGVSTPNVRLSGMADLKHLITEGEAMSRYAADKLHSQHNIIYDQEELSQVLKSELMGSGLFGLMMLAASGWANRNAQGQGMVEEENLNLVDIIKTVYSNFFQGYLDVTKHRADDLLSIIGVDAEKFVALIKTFCTSRYVELAESVASKKRCIPLSKLAIPAVSHLLQGTYSDSDHPAEGLSFIHDLYQPAIHEGESLNHRVRVNTAMIIWGSWQAGRGWINAKGQSNFGAYQGVLPMQQVITDTFRVTYLAQLLMLQTSVQPDLSLLNNTNSHAPEPSYREELNQSKKLILMTRPLNGLRVRLNDEDKPATVLDRLKNLIYFPVHTTLVVFDEHHQPEYFASAGEKNGRCVLADSDEETPPYFLLNDKKFVELRTQRPGGECFRYNQTELSLPINQVKSSFKTLMHREKSGLVDLPRYGLRSLGAKNCQTRLRWELLQPLIDSMNEATDEKLDWVDELPAYIFAEDIKLPAGSVNVGWNRP